MMLGILAQAFQMGPPNTVSAFGGGPSEELIAPLWQHYVLFGAILLLTLSLYIFWESISLQQFAYRGIEDAPNPLSGMFVVAVGVPLMLFILCTLGLTHLRSSHGLTPEDFQVFKRDYWPYVIFRIFIQENPLITVPVIALASLLPSALSVYK